MEGLGGRAALIPKDDLGNQQNSPSSKSIQPLHTSQTQELERRISFEELGFRDSAASSFEIEPSFGSHFECIGLYLTFNK